jgi:hypothetical protein
MVAWVAGEGALLNICLDEALVCDPTYPVIQTLSRIAARGMPPSWWDEVQPSMIRIATSHTEQGREEVMRGRECVSGAAISR